MPLGLKRMADLLKRHFGYRFKPSNCCPTDVRQGFVCDDDECEASPCTFRRGIYAKTIDGLELCVTIHVHRPTGDIDIKSYITQRDVARSRNIQLPQDLQLDQADEPIDFVRVMAQIEGAIRRPANA